jgi:hypothetical protein
MIGPVGELIVVVRVLLDDMAVVVSSDRLTLNSFDELIPDSDVDIDIDIEVVGVDCDGIGETVTEEAETVFDIVEVPLTDELVVGVIMEAIDRDEV